MASTFSRIINSYVHIEELEKIDRNKQIIKSENFINSPSNDSEIIEVENVFFKYFNSDFGTFENVSFKINKNKHYIISGANGAGKSTLLALIAGVLIPESGRITNRAKKIGYVGPTPLIIDGTLKENILYGNLEVHSDRKLLDLINELSLFDNDDDADLNMKISNKSLSSGQMQKISFLRIFLSDIDLLILDESTSNLDSNSKNKIVEKISNLKNVTILNSTHEPELFSFYDKKILIDIKENERKVIID